MTRRHYSRARPIIDIVVTVDHITTEEDYLHALLAAGYELRVREPRHRLVRTPAHDVHVHVFGFTCEATRDRPPRTVGGSGVSCSVFAMSDQTRLRRPEERGND